MELQSALQQLGASRIEATLVEALLDADALSTGEIVRRTGLRQPEVSVGMQALRSRNWVAAEPIPRDGKGRPMNRYRLVVERKALREHYAAEAKRNVDAARQAAQAIKDALK